MKSASVLDKIRATGAKPIPAWKFALSRWGVRAALLAALVLAAAAAALALREAWEPGADMMAGRMRHMPSPWALRTLPLLHLTVAASLVVAAFAAFRRLPTGHRWRLPALAASLLACVALAGAALGAVGGPRVVDRALRAVVPGFSSWSDDRREEFFREVWMRPGDGVIAGTVESATETGFVLRALDGSAWDVAFSGSSAQLSASGARVRVFGESAGSGSFSAKDVRAMSRRGDAFREGEFPFPPPGKGRRERRPEGFREGAPVPPRPDAAALPELPPVP